MSNDNLVQLPIGDDGKVDTSPEKLREVAEKSGPQVLKLIQKNRKESQETLQKRAESLQEDMKKVRAILGAEPLLNIKGPGDTVAFSLESSMRDVSISLGACLTSIESINSLIDMLIYDLGGVVHNVKQTQQAVLVSNTHTQTLLELLKQKGIVTEDEIKECWEQLVRAKTAEVHGELTPED